MHSSYVQLSETMLTGNFMCDEEGISVDVVIQTRRNYLSKKGQDKFNEQSSGINFIKRMRIDDFLGDVYCLLKTYSRYSSYKN